MRLSHRLTLVFSLFGVAIAGGFQYNHLREVRAVSYERQRKMSEAAGAAVKALVESQYQSGGAGRLGRNLDEIIRQTDIAAISVFDTKGKRLVDRYDDAKLRARSPHPSVPIEKSEDGFYDIERPVNLAGKPGLLEICVRLGPLEQRLNEIGSQAVRSGVMALLAITLSAWLIGTWFGLRIEQIVPRVESLARDPFAFKPMRGASDDDEVARLVAAFNGLGASLKSETLRRRELESEKQELAAMLVHDLKTPLTVIRSGIALLQEQMADGSDAREEASPAAYRRKNTRAPAGTQERTFQLLEMSTKRLQRMVEDVLQLARLEEVAGLRERIPVDIGAMIGACAKDFALVVADRKQRVAVKLPREPLPLVLGDATLLRRVLDNLAYNAVEHTPAGGLVTLAAAADPGGVRVSVSDSGPGVPPEARADLFRKFFQREVKRHVGNVGLGLAFCEKVVLRHEGVIGIEDAEPRGACFFFVLPSEQPHLL
jgi:signal transduction histidine kinase